VNCPLLFNEAMVPSEGVEVNVDKRDVGTKSGYLHGLCSRQLPRRERLDLNKNFVEMIFYTVRCLESEAWNPEAYRQAG